MDEHGMPDRVTTDRMVEHTLEALVEAVDDVSDAQRERDDFLRSTSPPTQPRKFDNLQAFLDFHWQVQTYRQAAEERQQAITRAIEAHKRATQELWDIFPFRVPLRYTYRGERESLQGQLYRIEKKPTGIEAHKQIPIEGE